MLRGRNIFRKPYNNPLTWSLVKSDRINALRKQYDAFLEEDKKRKERNDYILGRFDKMRFCTTMVPVRHKHNVFIDRKDIASASLCQPVYTSSFPHHTLAVDLPRRSSKDTIVLQEISKKYILIPKSKPNLDVSVQPIKPNLEDNTDWQSKYDILEQLKRDEKESDIITSTNKYDENKTSNVGTEDSEIHEAQIKSPMSPYKYEVPERDKVITDISYGLQDQAPINIQNEEPKTHATLDNVTGYQNNERVSLVVPETIELHTNYEQYNNDEQIVSSQVNAKTEFEPKDVAHAIELHTNYEQFDNYVQIASSEVNDKTELQPNTEYSNLSDEHVYDTDTNYNNEIGFPTSDDLDTYGNQYIPTDEEKDRATDIEKHTNVEKNETKPTEVTSPNNFVNEINSIPKIPVQENSELQENLKYPGSITVQEFTPAGELELQNVNPETYIGQENYNPTYQFDPSTQIVAQHTDDPVDTAGIEAFETEQKEMFYSEDADQNYAYNEDGTVEGIYNQDLTVQSSYPQHEQAVYYEGAETEQDYPIQIDEHEEAVQRYDPNYEEQYGSDYTQQYQQEGYEQQQFSEQPQYEPVNIDQAQQGIEQLQFEEQTYETIEHVQQQIDNEQGFGEVQQDHINLREMEEPIEQLQNSESIIKPN